MSCKDQFLLSSLESKIDKTNEVQAERLSHIKSQVIEKLKATKQLQTTNNYKRRLSCIGIEDQSRSNLKPRATSPSSNLQ